MALLEGKWRLIATIAASMNWCKTALQRMPIEVFVLGIPSFFLIVGGIVYRLFFMAGSDVNTIFTTFAAQSIGGAWFWMAFLAIICWLILRSGRMINRFLAEHDSTEASLRSEFPSLQKKIGMLWGSAGFILALTALCSIAVALSITALFHTASAARTIYFSHTLSEIEYGVFGAYPHFAIIEFFERFPSLDYFIVNGYNGLFVCVSFTFLLSLATSTRIFRRYVLAFFITFGIALPIWFIFPLVAPLELHVDNVFRQSQSSAVVAALTEYNAEPLPPASEMYRKQLEKLWIAPDGDWLAVSAFPSMHAGWALITIITLFSIDTLLGLIFVPTFIFCIIGTVYTLNHYVSDVAAGFLVGILAFWIAERVLRFEEKYRSDGGNFFLAATLMQTDLKDLWRKVGRFLKV